jgi:proteasomal ATPase-associated factor 1
MAGTPLYILPHFALQHDFVHVFADLRDHTIPSEDIFLSCYKSGVPSVHGKVNTSLDVSAPSDILLEPREGVDLKRVYSHSFLAGRPAFGIENTTLCVPRQSFNVNSKSRGAVRPITAFDVSPDASLIASRREHTHRHRK